LRPDNLRSIAAVRPLPRFAFVGRADRLLSLSMATGALALKAHLGARGRRSALSLPGKQTAARGFPERRL